MREPRGGILTAPRSSEASTSPTKPAVDPIVVPPPIDPSAGTLPPPPVPWRHPIRAMGWVVQAAFGLLSLVLALAVVAAIPLLNFYVLGYLLDVEGRVARSGRLREALPLVDVAPRFGAIVLGLVIWLVPLRFLAGMAVDARLIDPGSAADTGLHGATSVCAMLVTVHLVLALARGGSLGCFFRPIKNVRWLWQRWRRHDYWETAATHIQRFVSGLEFRRRFSLGFRGFVGAFAWLVIPTALLAAMDRTEGLPIFITLMGGLCLIAAFAWVPFLQAHFAAENRLRAMFELRTVRRLFGHAPLAWLLAMVVVYVLALPLYLFKVVSPPDDSMWGITLVFLLTIYPAKVLLGWAYHRAVKKDRAARRSGWIMRWLCRFVAVPLLASYVTLLFLTQFIGEHGKGVLFEHHAFLLPVPF